MADDRALILGHQRDRQRARIPQGIDDCSLGAVAMLGTGEGGGGQLADGAGIAGPLVANGKNHARRRSSSQTTSAATAPTAVPTSAPNKGTPLIAPQTKPPRMARMRKKPPA